MRENQDEKLDAMLRYRRLEPARAQPSAANHSQGAEHTTNSENPIFGSGVT